MATISNPLQEILDQVFEVRHSLNRLEKFLTSNPILPQDEAPINIDEAASLTGLAKPTIYSKFNRREIPGYRKGHRLFFYRSELLQWIRSGKRSTFDEIRAERQAIL